MKEGQPLSRKQMRKAKKIDKKQRIQKHQSNVSHLKTKNLIKQNTNNKMMKNNKDVHIPENSQRVKSNNKNLKKQQNEHSFEAQKNPQDQFQDEFENQHYMQQQIEDLQHYADEIDNSSQLVDPEDKQIALLEEKLMMGSNKNGKYEKLAKNMGFDEDLFSFLDNISKKVKTPIPKNHIQKEQKKKKKKVEDKDIKANKIKTKKRVQKIEQEQHKQQEIVNLQNPIRAQQKQISNPQLITIRKSMNSLLNKISDGNLTITLRQFIGIFQSYSKSETHQVFSQLFFKFNLLVEKPLVHILTANVVLAVALTMIYGSRVMAHILRKLTISYLELHKEEENQQQIIQIGYSRLFEKKKNYISLVCYFYQFQAITADFISSLILQLSTDQTDPQRFSENAELIYIIIQKCGPKMRNNDTSVLKQVLDSLKVFIAKSKQSNLYETTKMKFIEIQMNQIRFNRKSLFDADQRMGFLHTFLNKIVPGEAPVIQNKQYMMILSYQQIIKADTTVPHWWENASTGDINMKNDDDSFTKQNQPEEIKQLKQLAKKYHFVTETRRNIFVELMSSKDYLEATHKILDLKVKRLEEIATVLVQVNLREPDSFNPFYVLVAARLCAQIPKLRVCLQFSVWDRIKQLNTYDARKISNLAKFLGWLLASDVSNCSLSMLKFFTDLTNLKPDEQVLVKVMFKELFRKAKKQIIAKLIMKLKQQKNKSIRQGIRQYLDELEESIDGDISESKTTKKQQENEKLRSQLKFMKKLIYLQEEQEMDQEMD